MREATVAGQTAVLVATGQAGDEVLRREKILRVGTNGKTERDCALVDVAVSADRFVGVRALWRPEEISETFLASASPYAVGLSSVTGLLDPTPGPRPTASTCTLQTQVRQRQC